MGPWPSAATRGSAGGEHEHDTIDVLGVLEGVNGGSNVGHGPMNLHGVNADVVVGQAIVMVRHDVDVMGVSQVHQLGFDAVLVVDDDGSAHLFCGVHRGEVIALCILRKMEAGITKEHASVTVTGLHHELSELVGELRVGRKRHHATHGLPMASKLITYLIPVIAMEGLCPKPPFCMRL